MLALAILVAFIVARELERVPARSAVARLRAPRAAIYGLVLPALILFEYLSVPFSVVPPGWGVPIYNKIAQEPGDFALLELPLRPFGDYMAYQTVHGKPIIGGYLSRQPPYATVEKTPALTYLLDTTPPDDPIRAQVQNGQGVQQLAELNVKYVIIRWWAFTPEQKAAMQTKLNLLLGGPPDFTYPADQVDVWQLHP
jgi:hypothetical protein